MKRQIFGRKEGSGDAFVLMIESDGASSGGSKADAGQLQQFEIANTRRAVNSLREKRVEGYVLFGDDSTHYVFTPLTDFEYPANQPNTES